MIIVTDNFVTLFYGLVLRRSFIHSPVQHQLIVTRLTWHVTNSWPKAPTETVNDASGYVKDACILNPKAASTLTVFLYLRIVTDSQGRTVELDGRQVQLQFYCVLLTMGTLLWHLPQK